MQAVDGTLRDGGSVQRGGRGACAEETSSRAAGRRGDRPKGGRDASASAPGLAQLVGDPFKPGESVSIRGGISRNARIIVRAKRENSGVVQSDFDAIELPSGGKVEVETRSDGSPVAVIVTPDSRRFQPRITRRLRRASSPGAGYEPPPMLASSVRPLG